MSESKAVQSQPKRFVLKPSIAKTTAVGAAAFGAVLLLTTSIYSGYFLAVKTANPANTQLASPLPSQPPPTGQPSSPQRTCVSRISPTPTPNGLKSIVSDKYGLSFDYPQEWTRRTTLDSSQPEVIAYLTFWEQEEDQSSLRGLLFHLSADPNDSQLSLLEFSRDHFPQYNATLPRYITVGGRSGLSYQTRDDQSIQEIILFNLNETTIGIIRLSLSSNQQAALATQVQQVLDSIKIS